MTVLSYLSMYPFLIGMVTITTSSYGYVNQLQNLKWFIDRLSYSLIVMPSDSVYELIGLKKKSASLLLCFDQFDRWNEDRRWDRRCPTQLLTNSVAVEIVLQLIERMNFEPMKNCTKCLIILIFLLHLYWRQVYRTVNTSRGRKSNTCCGFL